MMKKSKIFFISGFGCMILALILKNYDFLFGVIISIGIILVLIAGYFESKEKK